MKRKLLVGLLSAVSVLVLSGSAEALIVTPADANFTTNDPSGAAGTDALLALAGLTSADLLYKSDVSGSSGNGSDSGDFADSYDTTFSNSASDPSDALIENVDDPDITCPECWLLVKDGNQTPAQYLISLDDLGWDGVEDLDIQGFWPENGAISHVSIYSAPGETVETSETILTSETTTATLTSETTQATVTPEPATLALLGSGLAIAAARLRRRKKV